MSTKTTLLYVGALATIGFISGAYAAWTNNREPTQAPAARPANASFVTPTISAAGGRDIATCPEGFLLQYQELGGASGGVICAQMTPPAD